MGLNRGILDTLGRRLRQRVRDVRDRLAAINHALASRSVPEDRRPQVSELALRRKAERAGQGLSGGHDEAGRKRSA